MIDFPTFVNDNMAGKNILIEGCNGILLDNIVGVRPYTTSCSTNLAALLSYASLSPYCLNNTYTIVGAYFVCLNKRPFMTEIYDNDVLQHVKCINSEIDNAEMKERRIGWFDLPALKRALVGCESNTPGKSTIFLTKSDVLTGLKEVNVCYEYKLGNKALKLLPDNTKEIPYCIPIYKTFKGWDTLESKEFYEFANYISKELEPMHNIHYISTGKETNEVMQYEFLQKYYKN